MAWADRPYNDSAGGGGSGGGGPPQWVHRLIAFINWSFAIGTYAATRVSVHITFVLVVLFQWMQSGNLWWTVRGTTLLFFSVLLHEFGHVLACRRVGGYADSILMWPLGGLAFCAPPRRPWPEFVTVACGPLVSLLLAAGAYAALWIMPGAVGAMPSWNPLGLWSTGFYGGAAGFVSDLFYVNYMLLLFNMLLLFMPFDGGRIVQVILWKFVGYERSIDIAATLGMIGAVGVALFGVIGGELFLVLIAVFGFASCYRQKQTVGAPMGDVDPRYAAAYEKWEAQSQPAGRWARWKANRRQQAAERANAKQADVEREVDRILAKVSEKGLHSLSEKEKRTLKRATESKRTR